MSSGYKVYSFDWTAFTDLTSNAESGIPSALAEALLDPLTRKKLRLPARLPRSRDGLAGVIRRLFLQPEWYADQPKADVKLRHQLLFGMFFEKRLKPIGLSVTPAWREFYECCSFDLGYCLAGRWALDLERMRRGKEVLYEMLGRRMKRGGEVFYKILDRPEHDGNEFWWFGHRPFRHARWQASNEDVEDFEEEYDFEVYSIHSPDGVRSLSSRLAEMSRRWEPIECKELKDLLADYRHCIEAVKGKGAGMLVENDP